MAIFQLRMGKVFPIFLSIHPLFRFNLSLLIFIRNIVSPDEIQKQGLQEEANEISLCQFSKMSRWGEITSTPTSQ